ncbi:MAG: hypothetical protein E7099_07915 [Mediterranea massiliensis]|nr:hypothetical protein [Mediterranea massiliensis]
MEKKDLNVQKSLELIAQMIQNTRGRLQIGNGNVFLLWGYTSIVVALLVGLLGHFSAHPAWNFLWFLIWIVGGTLSHYVEKRKDITACSYTDRLTTGIWTVVGYGALVSTAFCLYFMLFRGEDCWSLMLIFGLFVVGIATTMQGIVFAEKSLIWGGTFGMLAGTLIMCCLIAGIPLLYSWVIPLFVVSYIFMMVLPGHILNRKHRVAYV